MESSNPGETTCLELSSMSGLAEATERDGPPLSEVRQARLPPPFHIIFQHIPLHMKVQKFRISSAPAVHIHIATLILHQPQ